MRGLAPPAPLVEILRLVDALDAAADGAPPAVSSITTAIRNCSTPSWPGAGWTAEPIAGDVGEVRLRLTLAAAMTPERSRPLPPGAFPLSAKSQLLPASIPLRFFGAAVAVPSAWLALAAGAVELPRFGGGPGLLLAGLHLVTLGVLAMSAIGASCSCFRWRRASRSMPRRAPAAIWWLYTPGVACLCSACCFVPWLAALGAIGVVLATRQLRRSVSRATCSGARSVPAVVTHGWAALMPGRHAGDWLSMVGGWLGAPPLARTTAPALRRVRRLRPWACLRSACPPGADVRPRAQPDERQALASALLAIAALLLAGAAALASRRSRCAARAIALGAAAVGLHLG